MSVTDPVSILESHVDDALASALEESSGFRHAFFGGVLGRDTGHRLVDVVRSDVVNGRETDVLLVVERDDGQRFACLIEDKVTAGFTPGQPEAYRQRGEHGIRTGRWHAFCTVLFAPEAYLSAYCGTTLFDSYLPFERFSQPGPGASDEQILARLAAVLRTGIEKHQEKQLPPDDAARAFWRLFRAHVAARRLPFSIRRLEDRQSRADPWPTIYLKDVPGKRDHLCVQLKPRQGKVVLWFNKMPLAMLQELTAGTLPDDAAAVRDGSSASVPLRVPRIDHLQPFAAQIPAVEAALAAMTRLFDYCHTVLAATIDWPPPRPSML